MESVRNAQEGGSTVAQVALPMPDFRAIFETTPAMCLILTPEFIVVAATDVYLQASMTERAQLIGRYLFDVFPDNPADPEAAGVSSVTASFQTVLRTRRPHAMPVQRYDVQRPASEGGGFTERYWTPVNAPVLDAAGEVTFIIHRVEDVTGPVRLERERDRVIQELQKALNDLKTVSGMIPICAWCRKVRNDQGAWQQLEAFFCDRTEATFTHGVCTDCARNLSP
jgi:PAS fold